MRLYPDRRIREQEYLVLAQQNHLHCALKWVTYRHCTASLLLSSYYWSYSRWVKSSSFWGVWWLNDLPCQTRRARWVVGREGGEGGCKKTVGRFVLFISFCQVISTLWLAQEKTASFVSFLTKRSSKDAAHKQLTNCNQLRDSSSLLHND